MKYIPDRVSSKEIEKMKLNCLSFFSGAMGLDLGLEQSGINVLLASEIDNCARNTIVSNDSKIGLVGDIHNYDVSQILNYSGLKNVQDVDIIVGGPPCQSFSTAGKRNGFKDTRGNSILYFLDLIAKINPKYVAIENVRGLLSSSIDGGRPGSALYYIKKSLENNGYLVTFDLYNCANFGVAQTRERIVIICTKGKEPVPYLTPTHSKDGSCCGGLWKTFSEAVYGLNEKDMTYIKFSESRLKYFRMLGDGECWKNLPENIQSIAMGKSYYTKGGKTGFFRRLSMSKPSPTLLTHPAMFSTSLCHPIENRPISIEEYKRLQGFPDTWEVCGSVLNQYKQLGNAVPVKLGEAIGKCIINHHNGIAERSNNNKFKHSRYKNTSDVEWEKNYLRKK